MPMGEKTKLLWQNSEYRKRMTKIHQESFKKGREVWNKGKQWSSEIKKKLSIAHLGQKSWNKGTKGLVKSWNKGKTKKDFPQMANAGIKKGQFIGEKHWNWKGGKTLHPNGYFMLYQSSHPFCNQRGYVLRSHLIMEKYLGRYLKAEEIIHHKGIKYPISSIANKQDDRVENLYLCANRSEHRKFHNPRSNKHIYL